MKRGLILLFFILISTLAIAFSAPTWASKSNDENKVDFQKIYSHIMCFSDTHEGIRTAPKDNIYIFNDEDNWKKFKTDYMMNEISAPDLQNLPSDKSILYLQIDGKTPQTVAPYKICKISVNGEVLTVSVAKDGSEDSIQPVEGDTYFKYVVVAVIDKSKLTSNATLVLNIIDNRKVKRPA